MSHSSLRLLSRAGHFRDEKPRRRPPGSHPPFRSAPRLPTPNRARFRAVEPACRRCAWWPVISTASSAASRSKPSCFGPDGLPAPLKANDQTVSIRNKERSCQLRGYVSLSAASRAADISGSDLLSRLGNSRSAPRIPSASPSRACDRNSRSRQAASAGWHVDRSRYYRSA
jgi:hypothetical protein